MTSDRPLREKWLWHGEVVRLFFVVPAVIGATATVATYPFSGWHSLWFLLAVPIGGAMSLVYGSVVRRVTALRRQHGTDDGEVAEGLLVIERLQAPGIVVLRPSEVELIPIVGRPRRLSLADVGEVREGRWLPGKWVWGKRAFTLRDTVVTARLRRRGIGRGALGAPAPTPRRLTRASSRTPGTRRLKVTLRATAARTGGARSVVCGAPGPAGAAQLLPYE